MYTKIIHNDDNRNYFLKNQQIKFGSLGIWRECRLQARRIGNFLIKYNFMNPLIRIIGLIVATIGLQMIFDGITLFIKTLTV